MAGEGFDDFDGVEAGLEVGEDGGLIAGAGADFEDARAGEDVEQLGHGGDDVGLRDGLGVADGEGAVLVGEPAEGLGEEEVTRDGAEGGEDAGVFDAAALDLGLHHGFAGGVEVLDWYG